MKCKQQSIYHQIIDNCAFNQVAFKVSNKNKIKQKRVKDISIVATIKFRMNNKNVCSLSNSLVVSVSTECNSWTATCDINLLTKNRIINRE